MRPNDGLADLTLSCASVQRSDANSGTVVAAMLARQPLICNQRDAAMLVFGPGGSAAGQKPGRASFTVKLGVMRTRDILTYMSEIGQDVIIRSTPSELVQPEQVAVWRAHAAIRDAHSVVKTLAGVRGGAAAAGVLVILAALGSLVAMSPQRALLLPIFVVIATAVLLLLVLSYVRLTAAEASLYAMIEDVMRLEDERHRARERRAAND
jgi:hypothetical protein